jgi:hypothetical protein
MELVFLMSLRAECKGILFVLDCQYLRLYSIEQEGDSKNFEGSGTCLAQLLSCNLPECMEKNHEKQQNNWWPYRDLN